MRKLGITLSIFICLSFFCIRAAGAQVRAFKVEGIEIVEYGTYMVDLSSPERNKSLPLGERRAVKKERLIEHTDKIPSILGTNFGFSYTIKGFPKGTAINLVKKVLFPEMQDPSNKESYDASEWTSEEKIGETAYIGYGFDYEWEMASGEWTFQIFYENRKLGEKRLIVYRP